MAMFLTYYRRVTLTGAYKNLGMVTRGNFEALRAGMAMSDLTAGYPFSGVPVIVQGEFPEKIPGAQMAQLLATGQGVKVYGPEALALVNAATGTHSEPSAPLFT